MPDSGSPILLRIPEEMEGMRLDKALSSLLPEQTRATLQGWIKQERVRVNGKTVKQKFRLCGHEELEVSVPEPETRDWPAQKIDFEIVDEDDDIMVINKPAGLVVHPGAGTQDRTLLNGLIFHNRGMAALPRAGIVHRLDKDTTGLMVVAKTESARQNLIGQLDSRAMRREYLAIVNGVMVAGETINQPVGRHRHERLRMAVSRSGKPAITHIRVLEKFRTHCSIQATLETGRTHQIRVHLSWKGYPIVGDKRYGSRPRIPPSASRSLTKLIQDFPRQALHARKLSLNHPRWGQPRHWEQEPPGDITILVRKLAENTVPGG